MNFWFIKLFLPWFAIGIFFNQNADGDLFTVKKQNFRSSVYSSKLKQATLLELNKAELQNILDKRANTLNLKIPYLEQSFDVNLYQIDIFTDHFKVGTSGPDSTSKSYKKGVYYTGTVSNDPGSFISLSFFENELIGMISSKKYGDINIGKLNEHNDQDYIIFNDQDRFEQNNFNCGTVDTISSIFKMDEIKRDLKNQVLESRAAGCVGIDFEVANNIYVAKSSDVKTVTDWLTSLFVHIKTIYANEQIDIKINYIYIWTTPDSYTKNVNNTSITLNELANLRKSRSANPEFTGNLHHLVLKSPSSTSAAGVAWITSNPLCSDPYRFGLTFLWLDPVPVSLPYYLWDIGSVAHELGHNFGSPHTQSCDWAGGAIDGCVTQEGSCHVGPLPPKDGGTIMSYCHLVSSVGTKLSNGFGPLPGNLIRTTVRTSTCVVTGTCGGSIPLPTCNDGIQNGDETGVDCGGSCGPCGTGACPSPVNLSQGKTATQSSNFNGANSYPASMAVDGVVNSSNFNHTASELQPWWQVDLGSTNNITQIEITNRTGCGGCSGRIKRFKLFVSQTPINSYSSTSGVVYTYFNNAGISDGQVLNLTGLNASGRYVRFWVDNTGFGNNYLHLAEVKVLGCSGIDPCLSNQLPTISWQANTPTSYPQNSNITIGATAADVDGAIDRVDFYNGTTLIGSDNSSPYSLLISPASLSSYSLTAKAIDNCNGSKSTSSLIINTTSSCTDGFQNGTETGVDCGGNSCSACQPQGCVSSVLISQGKTTSQSSNWDPANSYPSSRGFDGIINNNNFTHTASELQPWLEVDLGSSNNITQIEITNRTGCSGCSGRIKRFKLFASQTPISSYSSTSGVVYTYSNNTGISDGQVIDLTGLNTSGRYVRFWVDNTGFGNNYLHLAEVKVFGCNGVDPCLSNQLPTISWQANTPTSYPQNSNITIGATAADVDGTIDRVDFYNGTTLIGSDNSSPYSLLISPASLSSYSLTAKAIDNCNGSKSTSSLIINTTSSCTDGFQNGTETGVDCGGNSCSACQPQGCVSSVLISQGKTTSQSSNWDPANSYPSSRGVDGIINNNNFSHTASELQPWWEVDLGSSNNITQIEITNRTGCSGCSGRVKRFKLFASQTPISSYSSTSGVVYTYSNNTGITDGQVINLTNLNTSGRYVRFWVDNTGFGNNYLHLAEVKVFGCNQGSPITYNEDRVQNNFSINENITIYPNPTLEELNIQVPVNQIVQKAQILDLSGKVVKDFNHPDAKINLQNIQAGVYFIKIYLGDKVYNKKFIKM